MEGSTRNDDDHKTYRDSGCDVARMAGSSGKNIVTDARRLSEGDIEGRTRNFALLAGPTVGFGRCPAGNQPMILVSGNVDG